MPEVMTLQDVAAYLKVHPNTVYRLARGGKIPAFKIGTEWRFHRAAIDAWTESRGRDTVSPEDEVFHFVFWMLSQGLSLTITEEELATVLDWSPRAVKRELRALERKHYLAVTDDNVALTPDGIGEGRRRFGRTTASPAGHESVVKFAQIQR